MRIPERKESKKCDVHEELDHEWNMQIHSVFVIQIHSHGQECGATNKHTKLWKRQTLFLLLVHMKPPLNAKILPISYKATGQLYTYIYFTSFSSRVCFSSSCCYCCCCGAYSFFTSQEIEREKKSIKSNTETMHGVDSGRRRKKVL